MIWRRSGRTSRATWSHDELDTDNVATRRKAGVIDLPTVQRFMFVMSLTQRLVEPGKMAALIVPPDRGIKAQPVEYRYVKL